MQMLSIRNCSACYEKSLRPLRLEPSGRFKNKTEPQRRKGRKDNYAFPIRGTDEERTMMEMVNRYINTLFIEKLPALFIG